MPPGPSRFYTPSKIPVGVTTSSNYTLHGIIWETANTSDQAWKQSSPFTATRIVSSPLHVPYFSQFADSLKNNECGETSVAMAAAYYVDLYDSAKAWITAVRNTIPGVTSSDKTDAKQLTGALWNLDGMQISVKSIPYTTSVGQAVQQIQAATRAGYPVIAFVDGGKLPKHPSTYGGHWLVITGINTQTGTVYINDPDSTYATGGGPNHAISLSVYEAAAQSGTRSALQPYGLIVTGENIHN
jgi:hypothetical protein